MENIWKTFGTFGTFGKHSTNWIVSSGYYALDSTKCEQVTSNYSSLVTKRSNRLNRHLHSLHLLTLGEPWKTLKNGKEAAVLSNQVEPAAVWKRNNFETFLNSILKTVSIWATASEKNDFVTKRRPAIKETQQKWIGSTSGSLIWLFSSGIRF